LNDLDGLGLDQHEHSPGEDAALGEGPGTGQRRLSSGSEPPTDAIRAPLAYLDQARHQVVYQGVQRNLKGVPAGWAIHVHPQAWRAQFGTPMDVLLWGFKSVYRP
jgi:hypothetical protein